MKKLLITLLKIGISAAIIAYLVWKSSTQGDAFSNLYHESKHWGMLTVALLCCTAAVLLTFVRWWYLVIALGVPLPLRDAMRISFWGYLFNFLPLGIVGGDVVKAVMLGHEHRQHRAKAVASVLADRIIGLYLLFVVATAAILLTGFWQINVAEIRWICKVTFILTAVGTVGLGLLLGPDVTDGRATGAIGRIPRVGHTILTLVAAMRMYNRKPMVLMLSSLMSIGVHGSFAVGCYLIACGLPGNHLSLADHFVVMPLSMPRACCRCHWGPSSLCWSSSTRT